MTDTAPAARLRELVEQWTQRAEWNRGEGRGGTSEALVCAATFESCADELEAVLRAVEAPAPPDPEFEKRWPEDLLRHAVIAPSQYDEQFRALAGEILRLRALAADSLPSVPPRQERDQ